MKRCSSKNCKQFIPKFHKNKSKKDGYSTMCTICTKEYYIQWKLDKRIVETVLDDRKCGYCGVNFTPKVHHQKYHSMLCNRRDSHLIAVSKCGSNDKYLSRRRAIRSIKRRNTPRKNFKYSNKDLELFDTKLSNKEIGIKLGRSSEAIMVKRNRLKKENEFKLNIDRDSSVSYGGFNVDSY